MNKQLALLTLGSLLGLSLGHAQDTPPEGGSSTTDTVFYCRFNSDTEDNYATQDWTTMNNTWEIIDHNNDGSTWYFMRGQGSDDDADAQFLGTYFGAWVEYKYNSTNAADDYLVLKNPLSLNAGTNFVSFCYKTQYGPGKYVENVALLYGKDRDVSTMDTLINLPGIGTNKIWEIITSQLELEENGDYYFAFVGYSNPDCGKLYLDNFLVGFSEQVQPADLVVENVFLPASDCGLSAETPIRVSLANTGFNEITRIGLSYTVNEGEPVYEEFSFDPALAISGRDTVTFATPADFSAEGTVYNVTVEGYVIPQGNEVPETDSTNNTASASTENFAPAALPFSTGFGTDEDLAQWTYDAEYWNLMSSSENGYIYSRGNNQGSPLVSRCIELEEGVTYSFEHTYSAGVVIEGQGTSMATFMLKYGLNGTPVEEWDTLRYYDRAFTNENWITDTNWLICEQSGIYAIAIVPVSTPNGSLSISNVQFQMIPDCRATFDAFNGKMAPKLPEDQVNGTFPVQVILTNTGAKAIEGLQVNILRGENIVGTASVDIDVDSILKQDIEITLAGIAPDDIISLDAMAITPAQDTLYPLHSSADSCSVTDTLMQYDYLTVPDFSIGTESEAGAGLVYTIKQADTLTAISVGWLVGDESEIRLVIQAWDDEVRNVTETLYEGRFERGMNAGHAKYTVPAMILEPGDYLVSVFFKGAGLMCDSVTGPENIFYYTYAGQVVPEARYGRPAIRAYFGHDAQVLDKDAAVQSIPLPMEQGLFSANEPIQVRVVNNGKDTVEVPVYVQIDKNEPLAPQTAKLPPYGNAIVDFSGDLSAAGEHLITAWTALEEDDNAANDTLTLFVTCDEALDPYVMDFESCQPFSLTNFNPAWISVDNDKSPNTGLGGFTFPHDLEAFGFIAFDPMSTTPSQTGGDFFPYQGFRYGAAFSSITENDNWLISPKLTMPAKDAKVSFAVKSLYDTQGALGLEQYNVLVSSTDNALESFQKLGETREAPGDDWDEVTVDLSEFAGKDIYIAFQHVTPFDEGFIFMIDDIRVSKPESANESKADAQLSLYPNPATEMVTIHSTEAQIKQVSLFNASGMEIYRSGNLETADFRYNMSSMAPGVYFAKVETAQGSAVLRFIVL